MQLEHFCLVKSLLSYGVSYICARSVTLFAVRSTEVSSCNVSVALYFLLSVIC